MDIDRILYRDCIMGPVSIPECRATQVFARAYAVVRFWPTGSIHFCHVGHEPNDCKPKRGIQTLVLWTSAGGMQRVHREAQKRTYP